MAIEQLKSRFNKELDKSIKKLYGGYAKGLGSKVVVNFILGGNSAVEDFIKGTSKVLDQMELVLAEDESAYNNATTWAQAVRDTNKKIKQERKIGRYKLRTYKEGRGKIPRDGGVFLGQPLKADNLRLDLILYAKNNAGTETQVQNIWDSYTKQIWNTWINNIFPGMEAGQTQLGAPGRTIRTDDTITRQNSKKKLVQQSVISAFRLNTKKEHALGSTRALFAIKDLEKSNPPLHDDILMQTTDVVEYIKENLDVDIDRGRNKVSEKYEFDNLVTLKLGSNPQLRSDRGNIKKLAEEFFRQEFATGKYNNVFGADEEGSKSPKQQVLEDVVIDLITPLTKAGKPDMRFKANKKFKKGREPRVSARKPTGSSRAIVQKSTGVARAMTATRPQKKKRQDTTDAIRVQKQINARLPAEVRRNMGRPALINRTSRFSNSVELKSLRQTNAGLSGDYTYRLDPYQTFENEGPKKWPSGYNPKTLIAKSIRNLALQYTEQKLVSLRRR